MSRSRRRRRVPSDPLSPPLRAEPRSAPQSSMRSKFRVARVMREVADAHPDLVLPDRPRLSDARPPLADMAVSQPGVVDYTPPRPRQAPARSFYDERLADKRPVLSGLDDRCKARPSSRRRGSGSGRAFVPWCK